MEHEVTGHTKKIYTLLKNPAHSLWTKFKEIAIEVLIIVFAVTLSIWLHDRSEHNHQQAEVKQFLTGLKTDLLNDIKEMNLDISSYEKGHRAFTYFLSIQKEGILSQDSLNAHSIYLTNSTGLVPNNGRYEGFKSSGKLTNIEDKELQNDISDLYQENIPTLINSTNAYNKRKEYLYAFYIENKKRNIDGTDNTIELIKSNKAHNIFASIVYTGEITGRYQVAIDKAKKIINVIDKLESK